MAENPESAPDYSFLAAFDQGIEQPRTSFGYFLGLLLAAAVSIVLPLIYLALVLVVAWGVFYHATHSWKIFELDGVGGFYVVMTEILAYFAPLFAGSLVVFFMLKPFFAREPKRAQPLALNPGSEPLFYAFVEKICTTVGAPIPSRIDLNCQLNAAAAARKGLFSVIRNDLVLVIGMPLVATLTVGELAGVIAHEFGHFRQGAGRVLSYVVGHINDWLLRVTYGRDAWDLWLEQWALRESNGWVTVVIVTTQFAIWFSRLILKGLVLCGVFIGGFMVRRMEYDADAYEIRVSGSAAFETTSRKFVTASAALRHAHEQMKAGWKKYRTLPDNFPEYLRRQHEQLSEPARQKFFDAVGLAKTRWFDSHPSVADRIRKARQAGEPGIFHDERPASSLFVAFEHPSRFVTLLHYRDDLRVPINASMLTPLQPEKAAVATPAPAAAPTASDAIAAYFLGVPDLFHPLRIPAVTPSANWEGEAEELRQTAAGLQQVTEAVGKIGQEYAQATEKLLVARAGGALAHEGVPVNPATFGGSGTAIEAAQKSGKEAAAMRESSRHSLNEVTAAVTRKLQLGLTLALAHPDGSATGITSVEDLNATVAELNSQADEYPRRLEMVESFSVLNRMLQYRHTRGDSPAFTRALEKQVAELLALAAKVRGPGVVEAAAEPQGLRLKTATRFNPYNAEEEVAAAEKETKEWLARYQANVEKLVQIARNMEVAVN